MSPTVRGWLVLPADYPTRRPIVWLPFYHHKEPLGIVLVPLWMVFALLALPTAFLWWRDWRRSPPGHCQTCGYDLTGNVSGVCPECGEAVTGTRAGRREA